MNTFLGKDSEVSLEEDSGDAVTIASPAPPGHGRHLVGVVVSAGLREADWSDVGVSREADRLLQLEQTHVIVELSTLAVARIHLDLGHRSLEAVRLAALGPVVITETHLQLTRRLPEEMSHWPEVTMHGNLPGAAVTRGEDILGRDKSSPAHRRH